MSSLLPCFFVVALTFFSVPAVAQNILKQNRYTKSVAKMLPPEAVGRIAAVHMDSSLPVQEKISRIHDIIVSLPPDVKNRLPLPPQFRKLPKPIRDELKQVFIDPTKSLPQKQALLSQRWQQLTPEQKQLAPNFLQVRDKWGYS